MATKKTTPNKQTDANAPRVALDGLTPEQAKRYLTGCLLPFLEKWQRETQQELDRLAEVRR